MCATETERDCGEGGRRDLGIFSVALVLACVPEESLTWAFLSVVLVAACARVYYHGERGIADLGISLSVALVAACARVWRPVPVCTTMVSEESLTWAFHLVWL